VSAWLAAPDGPGWWWVVPPGCDGPVPVRVYDDEHGLSVELGCVLTGVLPGSWARIPSPPPLAAPCHRADCVTTAPAPDCPAHGTHPALDWPAR